MKSLECRGCGRGFLWPRKKKFCSDECRAESYNAARRQTNTRRCGMTLLAENKRLVANGKKRCTKCREIKDLADYRSDPRGLGGATSWCKSCASEKDAEYRSKSSTKQARRKAKANYRRRNGARPRSEIAAEAQQRRIYQMMERAHKKRIREMISAEHNEETSAERYRRRYHTDPQFQMKERIRRQVTKAAKRDGVADLIRGAIRRNGKSPRVEHLLGYTIAELTQHIEKQFTRGMTWEKWRAGEIHIDHIIPQKEFDLSDPDEYRACWSMANLRPLWATDNLRKSANRETLL